MKYFVIAGEPSGDMHAAKVVNELRLLDSEATFKGIGGNKLKESGVAISIGLDRTSFMGFYEVLKNWRIIRKNFKEVKENIQSFQPDVVILVDYPGFNLRMAKWCKQQGYKVAYYISPTIWAWNEKRVEQVKKYVDRMICILPFEKAFYEKHQYKNAYYVGHPLVDFIPCYNIVDNHSKKYIALLPGSRKQELQLLLKEMLLTAATFPNEQFLLSGISTLKELYPALLPKNVQIVYDQTYELLQKSKAAIVCSGTATLEAALLNVPQIVVYKTAWINYQIGKRLAKVKFISLPNLIENKKIVTELIQNDCTVENISIELQHLLNSDNTQLYKALHEKIKEKGAAKNTANLIYKMAIE